MKSFRFVDACNSVLSKPETLKLTGKICSYVVLFLISWNSRESVGLGNIAR